MIRVLIVDDHQLYREGLRAQIDAESDMTVVGEAGDAAEAIDRAIKTRPDVILMDIDMPGLSCFDAICRVQRNLPGTRVVLCTGHSSDDQIRQAIESKAWGYVLKKESFAQVRQALHEVMDGKLHYAPDVLQRVSTGENGRLQLKDPPRTRLDLLTRRERELLTLLAQGLSLKEAGRTMNVSYKTVDKHKVSLMRKLDIHDRVDLARFAIREKVVQP
jgi:DNA-binding NarL/FixJ family response regulator